MLLLDPNLFFVPPPDNERQCIATLKSSTRCGGMISKADLIKASILKSDLGRGLREGVKDILRQIILLRVCSNRHRRQLEANCECLEVLVQKYENAFSWLSRTQDPIENGKQRRLPPGIHPGMQAYGQDRSITSATTSLADGGIVPASGAHQQMFEPYQNTPGDNVSKVIRSTVHENQSSERFVYAFDWPTYPGFVKIGYVKAFVEKRMKKWRRCHHGANLVVYEKFNFPERMERLIHLQLAGNRHQIAFCLVCNRTHFEWFKISADEAKQVIRDWKKVTERERLYTVERGLSPSWVSRIIGIQSITAQILLDALTSKSGIETSWSMDPVQRFLPTATTPSPVPSQSISTAPSESLVRDNCDPLLTMANDLERKLTVADDKE